MTVRTDDRLVDTPMCPVRCQRCAAEVTVRKSSWQQTSIQWHADALARCSEREQDSVVPGGCHVETCTALRESIADAAQQGSIPVSEDGA